MTPPNDPHPAAPAFSVASILLGTALPDTGTVRVQLFTDPLSVWCWGSEPAWLRLAERYGPQTLWEVRMIGLLQDEASSETGAAFNRPDRVAMQWEEAAHLTGMPVDAGRWLDRPPRSSWAACAAVKAAQAQDAQAAERLLRRLREAVVFEGADPEDTAVLDQAARASGLEEARFAEDLESGAAAEAFAADLALAADLGGLVAPSYVLSGPGGRVELRGAHGLDVLEAALAEAAGAAPLQTVEPRDVPDRPGYVRALAEARGSLTTAEAAGLLGLEAADAADLLDRAAAGGGLHVVERPAGRLYRA